MINYIFVSIVSSAVSLFICCKFLLPKMADESYESVRKLIASYHRDEVLPLQEILREYPDIVAEIHEDISKLEYDVDLLSSDGQVVTDAQNNSVKINNLPVNTVFDTQSDGALRLGPK